MYRLNMTDEQYQLLTSVAQDVIHQTVMAEGELTPLDIQTVLAMGVLINGTKKLTQLRRVS